MRRLNGWDAVLLYSETPNVHKHTLKIRPYALLLMARRLTPSLAGVVGLLILQTRSQYRYLEVGDGRRLQLSVDQLRRHAGSPV